MDVIILDMGAGVKGESTIQGFAGKMELLSFDPHGGGRGAGDVSSWDRTSGRPGHQDMTVVKYLDSASPVLNRSCNEGKVFPQAEVIIGRNDKGSVVELMRYTMKNVLISSISISGGGGDKPVETLTLNYDQISWTYSAPKQEGDDIERGKWDLSTNRAE